MSHALEECEFTSTEYFDECQECGELTACVCLYSLPQLSDYEIYKGGAVYSFRYWTMNGDKGEGSASTYREAMDAIAHAVNCGKERE